ncbi:MAG: BACON domain-containing protein [Dysgonomonas sp.]
MRKYFLLFAFVLSAIVTGCSSDDETDGNSQIKVDDKNSLTQTVYADNNEGKSGVKFSTTGAWTSTIKETGTQKDASTSASEWITISPDHGTAAGDYTMNIALQTNYTGKDRAATITIVCGDTNISITVTQEGKTEDGETPVEEKYDLAFLLLEGDITDTDTPADNTSLRSSTRLFEYALSITDEKGKEIKSILTLNDTCNLSLESYNPETKEAYLHRRYNVSGSDSLLISEIISINTDTKERKVLVEYLPCYDFSLVSANGKYVIYDKLDRANRVNGQVIKLSVSDGKEIILHDGKYDDFVIGSVSKDGSKVVLYNYDDKVIFIENDVQKYTFTGPTDLSGVYLSPDETKLLVEYGESGLLVCDLNGDNRQILKADDQSYYIETCLWSADAKYIYFNSYMKEQTILKLDVENKTSVQLTTDFPTNLYNNTVSIKINK